MFALVKIAIGLLGDASRFVLLSSRPSRSLIADNLFLRRQLALYEERDIKPRRIGPTTRVSLDLLAKLFD